MVNDPLPRGFSLLEIMVVIGMIGILASLAAPSVSLAVQRERSLQETTRVVAAIERARNRARVSVCKMEVTIDITANTISVGPDSADLDTSCIALPVETTEIGSLVTLTPFSIAGVETNPLVFEATGGVNAPARARMNVIGEHVTRFVEVWPAIGTVRSGS